MPAVSRAETRIAATSIPSAPRLRLGMVTSMRCATTKPGTSPSAEATTMHASTVACWRQYGAKSAPSRFQLTRRFTVGFSG